ncbi:tetratricopeptide repeat protein [Amycolatopsis mediterranei]|uniref:tetratricopeptide repeat protein n=1 Tax=Amycolatopsis mediterranei TaxID=33910 RepID=UPI0034477C09
MAARTQLQLGTDLQRTDDFTAALGHLTAAADTFQSLPDHRQHAAALLQLGRLARRQGHTDKAVLHLREAATLPTCYPADHAQTAAVLLELSETSFEQRDHVEGVEHVGRRARRCAGTARVGDGRGG